MNIQEKDPIPLIDLRSFLVLVIVGVSIGFITW